jgi:LmbE family N-acetylglucosaminyl deacetylase
MLSSVRGPLLAVITAVALSACSSPPEQQALAFEPSVRYMQVVAHADDDLIFMNPDLASGIRAGQATVGVYLTGGETDKPDAAAYAARRQAGTRAAYARMAAVPDDWQPSRLDVDARHAVELYTLRARPDVQVIFVNLPENNDPHAVGGKETLVRLWNDDRDELRASTLVPEGGTVRHPYLYTHNELIQLLGKLFDRFHPTVVRAQDPNPDKRLFNEISRFHDHPDHVMAARFTDAATRSYRGPRFVLENFRDYNLADVPVNLSAADRRDKLDVFGAYVPHDSDASLGHPYDQWLPSMYQRYPRGSTWTSDGRAYVVFGGRLFACEPGGDWTALPWADGALTQPVSAAGGWVAGKRIGDNEIVVLKNGSWTSLGNPNRHAPGDSGQVGSPVTTGKAVYVKNARGGLSMWRPGRDWTDIGGDDVQDGLAVTGTDIYASTRDKVLHWHDDQLDPGFVSLRPAGPPAATGSVIAYRVAGGEIAVGTRLLSGLPGSGNPAVTASGAVVARTAAGGLAVTTGSGWRDLGGQVLDDPAAMGAGVVALGPDGQVHRYSNF